MRTFQSGIILSFFIMGSALGLPEDVIGEKSVGNEKAREKVLIQNNGKSGKAPMRIEEPDGTLRPLPPASMPESRMSTEGLQETPDAGGGTMVNVEGRFQSILQVPKGSDKAIHGPKQKDLQQLKP